MGGSSDNRLLKVLHIDPEKNWGGGEAQVFSLLEHLADRGHCNDLLAHPRGQLFHRVEALRVRTFPLVMRNDLDVRFVPAVRRLIRRSGYDIVHFHTKRAHSMALWLPRGNPRPRYVVTRRMDYAEPATWYTRQLYNRKVDGVVAISESIAEVLRAAGVERGRIRCIPSGIDANRFLSIGARATREIDAATVVGCLGSLERRKGHQYLLEAAVLLKNRGIKARYLVGGAGPLKSQLENEVDRLGLREEVRFAGFIEDTRSFFAEIDVLAMPSLYEGLGVAALEGMAAGKPVVASRVGGLKESVLDGVTGILVAPQDAPALASAIAQLAADHELVSAMGSRGRERAREVYSSQKMALRNELYYRELLSRQPLDP